MPSLKRPPSRPHLKNGGGQSDGPERHSAVRHKCSPVIDHLRHLFSRANFDSVADVRMSFDKEHGGEVYEIKTFLSFAAY